MKFTTTKNKLIFSLLLTGIQSVSAFSPSSINQRHGAQNSLLRSPSTTTKDLTILSSSKIVRKVLTLLFASKVGIFFGTSTGSTEGIADMIAEEFGDDFAEGPFEIDELQGSIAKKFGEYDALIVGTPTWNTGADVERSGTGWDEIYYGEMQDLNISNKKVAVFGLGDQLSYAENYADASGELHDVFENLGCTMLGYTSQEGYEHEESKAVRGDKFCGLLCDAVNQDFLSEGRVKNWVAQLKSEGILDGASSHSVPEATTVEVVEASSPPMTPKTESADDNAAAELAALKAENARLRELLEDNSRLMDSVLKGEEDQGFTPHYNAKTGRTMWTSQDGRACYYTVEAPKSP